MTDFFTHCCRSWRPRLAAACACLSLLLLVSSRAHADAVPPEVTQLRVERSAEGLFLFASVRVELPAAVEDALLRGVPMFFVAEADVVRHRWYWSDRKVASVQRHMRLAYQPLTQRWRLNVAPGIITSNSLGMTINQSFDTLPDAMAAVQRLSGWKIAEPGVVEPDSVHKVEFRFSLDLTQLPRPFQIGTFGQSDWTIAVSASKQISSEALK